MNHSLFAFAFQEVPYFWPIVIVVVVFLVLAVVVIAAALAIFFTLRKRKKARLAAASAPSLASGYPGSESASGYTDAPAYAETPLAPVEEPAATFDAPPPNFDLPTPVEEIRADISEAAAAPVVAPPIDSAPADFDPSRTVAISRENTVTISYGSIKFVSGVLAGEQFEVQPEGTYIGRESSLAQIVVADPRISKRHLWIGVREGQVTVVDQDSRNGTFINDPKSERITEAVLHTGDTVILGESDVARFEYQL